NVEELDSIVRSWTSSLTRAEVVAALRAAKVPAAAVRDVGEVVEDRHLHERGAIQHIDHPQLGDIVVPHSPLRFRGEELVPLVPSRALGADNEEVFGRLGLGLEEVEKLRED